MRRECRERFPTRRLQRKPLVSDPACITARASRTCREACRDRLPAVAGKTFPAFPAHAHPQFYVSGKRPMHTWLGTFKLPNPVCKPLLLSSVLMKNWYWYILGHHRSYRYLFPQLRLISELQLQNLARHQNTSTTNQTISKHAPTLPWQTDDRYFVSAESNYNISRLRELMHLCFWCFNYPV